MKITVKRYDPSKDNAPYETTYEVPHDDEYMTLLQALVYIHENEEPLAFDFSCRGRMCGRCAMMLDGEPVLACVEPLPDGSHTVEPLAGLPVVKDLVVDKSQVQEKIAETYKRVRVAPLTEEDLQTYNMEDADELFGINYCARCQVCTAGCPARAINPVEAVQGGLWDCTMCGTCTAHCNQLEIDHLAIWQKLRDAATERGLVKQD